MTSLESIVLPLEQSRALVEKGIVLDTALGWVPAEELDEYEVGENGEPVLMEKKDTLDEDDGPMYDFTPAPVLSELLDAVRWAVHPMVLGWDGTGWTVRWVELDDRNPLHECSVVRDSTDLLAAYALLMEVAK